MADKKHTPPPAAPQATTQSANQPEFAIQRVYIKDLSFEAPQSPVVFQHEWKPELNLQVQTLSAKLADDVHEVTLKLTVTAKTGDAVAFLIEVQQAGIFTMKHFPQDQMGALLNSACPNILFPYARETISDLASRGTFPPLYLAPINFDALYMQHLEQQKQADGKDGKTH